MQNKKISSPKSIVFFAEITDKLTDVYKKIENLFTAFKIKEKIQPEEIVAIKMHFGEEGNLNYIRPGIVSYIVELIKKIGAKPFLVDTTSLYKHKRADLFSHLETAQKNGFSPSTMNCPIIIADGFKNNGTYVTLNSLEKLSKVKVAQAIYEADVLLNLSHITFHYFICPAASIKNIGMGCVTKESKIEMHTSNKKPLFNSEKCINCGNCLRFCPGNAFKKEKGKIQFLNNFCINCAECIAFCKGKALDVCWDLLSYDVQIGILDGYKAVTSCFKKEKILHINIGLNIGWHCDCISKHSIPILPDIGILASMDGLSIDKASYDLMVKSQAIPFSKLDKEKGKSIEEKIELISPQVNVENFFAHAAKQQIGNLNYELVKI